MFDESHYAEMQLQLDALDLETDPDAVIRIWLGSLEAYNAGHLIGRWIALPCDDDELCKAYDIVTHNGAHDYFIADYESPVHKVNEYDSPFTLNDLADQLDDIDEDHYEVIRWLVRDVGDDLEGAIENYENVNVFASKQKAIEDRFELMFADVSEDLRYRISQITDWDNIWATMQTDSTLYEASDGRVFVFYG